MEKRQGHFGPAFRLSILMGHSTFYVLPVLLQVFLEVGGAVAVVSAEPEVAFAAAEFSGEVVVFVAEPEVAFAAAEFSGEVVVFVAAVLVADVAEPRFSADIPVPSGVSVPVSVVVAGVDNPGPPRFFVFPSIDYDANSASFVEIVGEESVHNSTGARANCGSCSILSSLGLHHNKTAGHCYSNPSPGHNTVSDTYDHTMDATTSHSRKRDLHLSPEQRKRCPFQARLSPPEVRQTQWETGDQN